MITMLKTIETKQTTWDWSVAQKFKLVIEPSFVIYTVQFLFEDRCLPQKIHFSLKFLGHFELNCFWSSEVIYSRCLYTLFHPIPVNPINTQSWHYQMENWENQGRSKSYFNVIVLPKFNKLSAYFFDLWLGTRHIYNSSLRNILKWTTSLTVTYRYKRVPHFLQAEIQ